MEVEAWAAEGFRCVICGVKTLRVFKGFAHSGGIERHYGPAGCRLQPLLALPAEPLDGAGAAHGLEANAALRSIVRRDSGEYPAPVGIHGGAGRGLPAPPAPPAVRLRHLTRIIPEARYSGSTGRGGTTNRVSPSSFGGCEGVAGRAMGRWPGAVSPSVDSFSWRRSVSSPRELGAAGRMGYPARAPSARAMRCHASRCGVARGRCRTSRRTERTTWTPSLSNRSRSHVTWVRAHAVPAARSRSSCIST